MAIITHGSILPDSAQKTDFYAIVDSATISGIADADISNGAGIQDSKLASISSAGKVNVSAIIGSLPDSNLNQIVTAGKVSGAALTLLPNIPSGAGIIPLANIGALLGSPVSKSVGTTYQAASDGIVTALVSAGSGGQAGYIQGVTDSSASPTTVMGQASVANPVSGQADHTVKYSSFTMYVKKNDYYAVSVAAISGASTPSSSMVFQPIGS